MGERSEHKPGTFSWVDLGTTDAEGAKAFYGDLFGWEAEDAPTPDGGTYSMLRVNGKEVAALYQRSADALGPPAWLSYVTVEDTDAITERALELGAAAIQQPFDVMEAGRMAVLQDPQGAVFAVWQPGGSIGATLVNDPGALTLNQLNAADMDVATRFYSELFGWRIERAVEDPPYWGIFNGQSLNGGMMPLPPEAGAPSHWLAYFTTDDLDAAAERIGAAGGTVVVPQTEIQSGRILVAVDPQGAHFALFEGEVDP